MDRRTFLCGLTLGTLTAPLAAEGQAVKVWRIGYLSLNAPERARQVLSVIEAGLHELGYRPGKDVIIESWLANGQRDRLPDLARRLIDSHVDLILVGSNVEIAAAKKVTSTIPIVMMVGVNPVDSGFIISLSRPGGDITGLTFDATPDSTAKNLQLLKETVPTVSRIGLLWDPSFPGSNVTWKL